MAVNNLEDLFSETLKDIYYAEKKLVKSLPKLIKKVHSPELKSAIQNHLSETEVQVTRLEKVFAFLDKKPVAKKCEAIEGMLKEADEVVGEIDDAETLDAGIISSAQTVEHYEMARYGTLICWAQQLGWNEVEAILQETLEEEKAADKKLSGLADHGINQRAAA